MDIDMTAVENDILEGSSLVDNLFDIVTIEISGLDNGRSMKLSLGLKYSFCLEILGVTEETDHV